VTKIDLKNIICFQINWDLYQKYLALPENIKENIHKQDVVEAAEADVKIWKKLMERVCDFYRSCLLIKFHNIFLMFIFRLLLRVNNYGGKLKL